MTKYLPWFLFLTGIQSYAFTAAEFSMADHHASRDFFSFKCKVIRNNLENNRDESALLELRKNPISLTNTLRSNISFNLIIKPQLRQAAVYINGGIFAVLKKDANRKSYSHINNYYDQNKSELHQSIYRLDQIQLDDFLHQITARLKITKRIISHHSVRPHYSEYLTRTYQCVTE